jgi:hypothetical protein
MEIKATHQLTDVDILFALEDSEQDPASSCVPGTERPDMNKSGKHGKYKPEVCLYTDIQLLSAYWLKISTLSQLI